MIYTSYFGKIKSFPNNFEPICIARWKPKWYHGKALLSLAPSDQLLRWWRAVDKNASNWDRYKIVFEDEILLGRNPRSIEKMIKQAAGDKVPILVCFEKGGYCHRHLIAAWLRKNGIKCEEWEE
jgi:uncharacterized protein YeaO (DUF488 family)